MHITKKYHLVNIMYVTLTLTLFIFKALKSPYGVSMVLYMNFTDSTNTIIIKFVDHMFNEKMCFK